MVFKIKKQALTLGTFTLALLVPFATFLSENVGEPDLRYGFFISISIIAIFTIFCASVGFAALLSKFRNINFERILITLCFLWLLFFFFGPIHGLFTDLLNNWGLSTGAMLLFFLVVIIVGAIAYKLSKIKELQVPIFVAFLCPVSISVGQITIGIVDTYGEIEAETWSPELHGGTQGIRSNIYFIVPDEYASEATLNTVFGFDNSEFIQQVESRGFSHASRALSPYTSTYLSLSALLMADYITSEDDNLIDFIPYWSNIRNGYTPRVMKVFSDFGYNSYVVRDHSVTCWLQSGECPTATDRLPIPTEFKVFLSGTPLSWAINKYDHHSDKTAIQRAIDALRGMQSNASPFFMMAHQLTPHAPFRFNPDCSIKGGTLRVKYLEENKPHYLDNIQCTNKHVLEFMDYIIEKDSNAIVVIMADHGSGFTVDWNAPLEEWTEEQKMERTSALMLYRFPAECPFDAPEHINSINLMRLAIACVSGTEPELLPNKSYITDFKERRAVLYRQLP